MASSDMDQAVELREALAGAGYEVHLLKDGLRVVPEAIHLRPHVIILDRQLPFLGGAELLQSLASFEPTQRIPVILRVTTDCPEAELLDLLRKGATDLLRGSFELTQLRRIQALVELPTTEDRTPTGIPWDAGASRPMPPAAQRVITYFRREKRDGTLLVNPGTPFEGRAVFSRGRLLNCTYGEATGLEAFTAMLDVDEAVLRFVPLGEME